MWQRVQGGGVARAISWQGMMPLIRRRFKLWARVQKFRPKAAMNGRSSTLFVLNEVTFFDGAKHPGIH